MMQQAIHPRNSEPGVLITQGKKYAVGLTWLTATSEDDKRRAKSRARKAGGDFYCIRSGVASQHGVGWLSKGHRANQTAAASLVADVLVGDWHGVFKAENGWWYVKVFSDVIAPDGDIFFESEEEAYNHFIKNHEGKVWAHAYAPAEWDIQNITKEVDLNEILDDVPSASLIPGNMNALFGGTRNKNVAIVFFLIVIAAGVLAFMGPIIWKTMFSPSSVVSDSSVVRKVELPDEIKELPSLASQEEEVVTIPKPSNFIEICGGKAANIIQPVPGWSFLGLTCEAEKISLRWQKAGGTLNMAKEQTQKMLEVGEQITLEKDQLVVKASLPIIPGVEHRYFLNTATAVMQLENRFLNVGGLSIEPVIPPKPEQTPYQKRMGITPTSPQPYLKVTVNSDMSPKVLGNYFDIKGLELQKIEWNFATGVWTYTARVLLEQ